MLPRRRAPYESTKPNVPCSTRSTATSATAPDREMPERLLLHLARGIPRGPADHVVERHAEREELAHHVQHVLHAGVHAADVEVGRNRVRAGSPPERRARRRARGSCRRRDRRRRSRPRFRPSNKAGFRCPGRSSSLRSPEYDVRVDVAGPQLRRDELGERPFRLVPPEIDHHRDVGGGARLDRALHRRPFRPGVVRRLDPDDRPAVGRAPRPPSAAPPCRRGPARTRPPRIPWPTMLRKASTRVRDRAITRDLKSSKFRQPELPASTTVVTPARNVKPSG